MSQSRLHNFPLLTAEEIENTPSRQDGVSAAKEARLWKKIGFVIFETAKMMQPAMSSGTAAIAMTFSARFYTLKSLARNSPPLIAAAALVLAGKCNDEPRHLLSLVAEVMKQWYGRQNPDLRSKLESKEFQESLIANVQEAELVLMFTLKFDFNVDPLVVEALYKIKETDCLANALRDPTFQQFLVSSANDIMRRDAGMVLQYRGADIGLAICQLFFKVNKQRGAVAPARLEPPPDPATGAAWYVKYGLTEEIHRQISGRFHKLYANVRGDADGGDATTAAGGGGAAESAGLTDGEALGGGGAGAATSVDGGGGGGGEGGAAMSIDQRPPPAFVFTSSPVYLPTSPPEHRPPEPQPRLIEAPTVQPQEHKIENPKPSGAAAVRGRRMISMDQIKPTVSHGSVKLPAKRPCSWDDEPVVQPPAAGSAGWIATGSGTGTTPSAPMMPLGGQVPTSSQQNYQQQQYHSVYTNYAPPSATRRPTAGEYYNKSYDSTAVPSGGRPYHPPVVAPAAAAAPAPASDSEVEEGELEEGEIR